MQRSFLPELTENEAATARQLAELTGLPIARVIRLISRSKFWRARFVMATYSAASIRAWSDGIGQRKECAPVRQQAHLSDFAASLMEEDQCAASSPSN